MLSRAGILLAIIDVLKHPAMVEAYLGDTSCGNAGAQDNMPAAQVLPSMVC
jgi:hypothetical protein